MKLPRLRTLATAGTVAGTLAATVMLTAPQANAMPTSQWVKSCMEEGGSIGFGIHYNFDENMNVVSTQGVPLCRIGSDVHWNTTDIDGEPVGGYDR
jgi:hypothetical protein